MRFIAKILLAVLVNAAVLIALAYWVPGITLPRDAREIAIIAVALTALNLFLKPILKLILGPIIILTLGIGLLVVNAVILFLLDFWFASFTIQDTSALILATLVTSATNVVYHFATKSS